MYTASYFCSDHFLQKDKAFPSSRLPANVKSVDLKHVLVQGEEEETQQKPVWLQEDGQEVGSPSAANASQLHLEGPTPTQPMDPQGAADFIGLDDDDTPGWHQCSLHDEPPVM